MNLESNNSLAKKTADSNFYLCEECLKKENLQQFGDFRKDDDADPFKVVSEKRHHINMAPMNHSVAYCVSKELGREDAQVSHEGLVSTLEEDDRYTFYLIVEKGSDGKMCYGSFLSCLEELKRLCVEHAVKNLVMPRLCCDDNEVDWTRVKWTLEQVFSGTGVLVTVYVY